MVANRKATVVLILMRIGLWDKEEWSRFYFSFGGCKSCGNP